MESDSLTSTYSPLGWSIWLYGPMLAIAGVIFFFIWWTSLTHNVANSGMQVHGIVDWLKAAICRSARCNPVDYPVYFLTLVVFPATAFVFLASGVLMMNSNRTTVVSPESISTFRGAFIHWGRRTWTRVDIASVDIDTVPITMVYGNRATTSGFRYNVGVIIRPGGSEKPRRTIIGLFPSEASAQQAQSAIQSILR